MAGDIGSVSVKALPDTSDFVAHLREQLGDLGLTVTEDTRYEYDADSNLVRMTTTTTYTTAQPHSAE